MKIEPAVWQDKHMPGPPFSERWFMLRRGGLPTLGLGLPHTPPLMPYALEHMHRTMTISPPPMKHVGVTTCSKSVPCCPNGIMNCKVPRKLLKLKKIKIPPVGRYVLPIIPSRISALLKCSADLIKYFMLLNETCGLKRKNSLLSVLVS